MAEPSLSSVARSGDDDLPRTLRREREAQARRAREYELDDAVGAAVPAGAATMAWQPGANESYGYDADETVPATVTRLQIPFFHMMLFFLKAVIAAIPALILLLVILWGLGEILTTYFAQLVKMQILIRMPH